MVGFPRLQAREEVNHWIRRGRPRRR